MNVYSCTLYSCTGVQLYTAFMYTTDGIYLQYTYTIYENGTANLLLIYC